MGRFIGLLDLIPEMKCVATIKRLILLMIISTASVQGITQTLAQHNWYFGSTKNGIRFNRANNKAMLVTNKATPFGTGGSAVATDPGTADLIFYTDGNRVYDATHVVMPNGTGLNANSSANQPVAICAVPGQANKYFIFTNTANFTTPGSISVTVVDLTAFGNSVFPAPPLGAVTTKNTPVAGLTSTSEGMIIVPHANMLDFWLITQVNGTTAYNATLINAASFTSNTFVTTTSPAVGKAISVANFAYSPKLNNIAVSPQNSGTDVVILRFDNSGSANPFTLLSTVPNSGAATTGNQSLYDAQWDNEGQYLYISRTGEPGLKADLLQFDALNPTNTLASLLPAPVFRSYGLQLAPDSAIYYLYQSVSGGPFLVDKFTNTDTVASAVKRTATPFGAIDFGGTQFPEFLPKDSIDLMVNFTYNSKPNCQNTITSFYPAIRPNADSLHWSFGDGKDTTTWSPNHTYSTSGTFSVTLSAFYQGQEKDTTRSIVITPFALTLKLVSDTTACECQLPARQHLTGSCSLPNFSVTVKVSGGTPVSYHWSNLKDSTATLHPDSAGYYYVVVKDASGCSAYAGVNVKEFELQDMRENIWYFGDHAGIDFNTMPIKALNTSAMDAPAGCAIACDRDGQVVIYTDGDKVWDKKNVQIASGIGGDPASSQSSIIIPVSGDETLYYIFTTQAIGGSGNNEMRYSLYDLKKDSVVIQNVLLFSKSSEHLTGNNNWVIAHEYGNNTFRAYPVSIKGIGDPVYSAIGSDLSFEVIQNGQGYMKLGGTPKNNLAVALSTPGTSNIVELYDFTDSTGLVTNYRKIDLKQPAGQVYGVEFSGGGNKLYASVDGHPTPSYIYEYSIDSVGQSHLKNKTSVNAELGAIQIAPNGQIYVAVNGATSLGTIAANDDTTAISAFTLAGFGLAPGTNSELGLPNFRQMSSNSFSGPSFTFNTPCVGDTTKFMGVSRDPIDKFQWTFGDGGSSTEQSPAHLYAKAGVYTVVMLVSNRCPNSRDSVVQKVTVYPPPAFPTLKGSNALCNGPLVLDANTAGTPGLTYNWSTGDTTRMITVKTQIFSLSVTNTDQHGCSSTAKGSVGDARPKLELGPDQTICENTLPAPVLNASNPNATYLWTVPSNVAPSPADSSTQIVAVDSIATLSPQKYKVVVTIVLDPVTGRTCSNSDSVNFQINPTPYFTFTGIPPAGGCGSPNGSLTLTFKSPVADLFTYAIYGDTSLTGQDKAANVVISDNKARAGNYNVIVTDQVSQCAANKSVQLSDQSVNVSITPRPLTTCSTITITATTNISTPFQYIVQDEKGTTIDAQPTVSISPFTTKLLPPGFYSLEVLAGKCKALDTVTIKLSNPPLPISIAPAVCNAPQTLTAATTAPGTPSYVWSGPAIVSGGNTNVVTINPGPGEYLYSVVGTLAGYCPTTKTDSVKVSPLVTPAFTQSGNCTNQVTLLATPNSSAFTYTWYLEDASGTFNLAGTTHQIFVNSTGTYLVDITDVNGCIHRSPSQLVNVYGELKSGITATQACANNSPFTLTATVNTTAPVTYSWLLNGTVIANQTSPTLVQMDKSTTPETYMVIVSTATCKDTSALIVIPAPVPVGHLPTTGIICDDPTNMNSATRQVRLTPGNTFVTYEWFKNEINQSDTDSTFIATSAGTYSVVVTNVYGCRGRDSTILVTDCEPILAAPTAFRPGSNIGENQTFSVITAFVDDFHIFIFNRWGELIYESGTADFKWDGTAQASGNKEPGGTYAYVIKYVSTYRPEQGIHEKHGGIVLLR